MQKTLITQIANELYEAQKSDRTIEQISARYEGLTIDLAYEIQAVNRERFIKEGEVVTGKKIGLTSLAMQQSLGVDQPDYGFLFQSMDASKEGVIPARQILQPRVEGELAFVLKADLPAEATPQDVLKATDYVVPAIEVVGSRIQNWKLTIVDTIADNASCGMYILGKDRIDPEKTDLQKIHMTLSRNGEMINSGEGSAVLGDPAVAVAWLADKMGQYGIKLNKGDVILSGALSAAVPANPGDSFICDFGVYGSVQAHFSSLSGE